MRFRRSLRYRVGLALGLFGGVVSLLLSAALFLFFQQAESQFVDDMIDSEIAEFLSARADNPQAPLPKTWHFRAYSASGGGDAALPPELRMLPPGRHELQLGDRLYRAAVINQKGERLYLLYDETGLHLREWEVKTAIGVGIVVMMLFSAAAGTWLAGRVISPVSQLRRQVRALHPGSDISHFSRDFADDEIGELATTFENYLARMHAFIERERNFTADASHELRTPLSIISGAIEVLLGESQLPPHVRSRLERIERAANDMCIVMQGLLTLAREPGGTSAAQGAVCDVVGIVREVIAQNRPLVEGKPLEIEVQVLARPRLSAQPALLAVAVGNLVRNALIHTAQGRVTISVYSDRVVVEDTGPGFPDPATALSGRVGIGLSLVRRVCSRYGWQLALDNRHEGGARAEIQLGII